MTLYDFEIATIDGRSTTLTEFRGLVLLVVNVASQCRLTPQYAGLEDLYRRHRQQGFAVLGFPCNQFGHQEPGGEAEIQQFCSLNYGVSFPMFAKIDVNGANTHPLYRHLKSAKRGFLRTSAIKWNFTKFLIDRAGEVRARYGPIAAPARIERDLIALLN